MITLVIVSLGLLVNFGVQIILARSAFGVPVYIDEGTPGWRGEVREKVWNAPPTNLVQRAARRRLWLSFITWALWLVAVLPVGFAAQAVSDNLCAPGFGVAAQIVIAIAILLAVGLVHVAAGERSVHPLAPVAWVLGTGIALVLLAQPPR